MNFSLCANMLSFCSDTHICVYTLNNKSISMHGTSYIHELSSIGLMVGQVVHSAWIGNPMVVICLCMYVLHLYTLCGRTTAVRAPELKRNNQSLNQSISYYYTHHPSSFDHDMILASYISWKLMLSSFCQVTAIDYLASR